MMVYTERMFHTTPISTATFRTRFWPATNTLAVGMITRSKSYTTIGWLNLDKKRLITFTHQTPPHIARCIINTAWIAATCYDSSPQILEPLMSNNWVSGWIVKATKQVNRELAKKRR